ncbi:MAG: hypothetical protein ACOY93_09850 [Bacillota bacterium]
MEELLRAIGGEAADLAASLAAALEDPVGARAGLPANYRLRTPLQKSHLPGHLDLESDLPEWVGEVTRYACDVPVLLEAEAAADRLGPVLTADLPRALQARFGEAVRRLRQGLQGRRLRAMPGVHPEDGEREAGLSLVVPQPEGYAVVLPRGAGDALHRTAWRELACLLLAREGADVARLHLQLLGHWPHELSHGEVRAGLGLRRPAPERCYEALRRLQQLRLSLYQWELEGGLLTLEHQARDLWALRLREGGQAHLVDEGGTLVARGQEWWITPGGHSWAATLEAESVESVLARTLLGELEGSRNPLSLALGLLLSRGQTTVGNRELLRMAGFDVDRPQPELWTRVRAAARLQRRAGWEPDLSRWGKRNDADWEGFLAAETTFLPTAGDDEAPPR